jgi:hypothetical protein
LRTLMIGCFSALLLSQTARADDGTALTVDGLSRSCLSPQVGEQTFCAGYVTGMADLAMLNALVAKQNHSSYELSAFCNQPTTASVSHAALIQAFRNWHDKHPEMWTQPAIVGVIKGLQDAWPCPKDKP